MSALQALREDAERAREAFTKAVDAMEPELKKLFPKLGTNSFKLPFPVDFAGPDFRDTYQRLVIDENDQLLVEDSAGLTDVGDLDESTRFAIYTQVVDNYK